MSNESKPGSEVRISETDVRRILDRAIQLDSLRTNETTLAELQRVADEVVISSGSITQAIEEFRLGVGAPVPASPQVEITGWRARLRRFARPLVIGGISSMLGFFTAAMGAEEAALGTFFLSIATSLILALVHRARRREDAVVGKRGDETADNGKHTRALQLDLLAVWLPWSFLNGLAEEEILIVGGLAWTVAALVGMGIVELFQPKRSAGISQERSTTSRAAV